MSESTPAREACGASGGGVTIRVEEGVGLVRFSSGDRRCALSRALLRDVAAALESFESDGSVRCAVLAGDPEAFGVGADLRDLAAAPLASIVGTSETPWDRIHHLCKPVIAAVSGLALGGGCELALACDMIVASRTARFGQPEAQVGVIPGGGGTQRLAHALGKALAMEVVLAGRLLTADEALAHGLVNRVSPVETYLQDAVELAARIASRAPLAVQLGKEAVRAAHELPLSAGLSHERRLYCVAFSSADREEGFRAFLEKREPVWNGQ